MWLFVLFTSSGKIATCIFLICFLWMLFFAKVFLVRRHRQLFRRRIGARPFSKVTQCHFFNILTAYDCWSACQHSGRLSAAECRRRCIFHAVFNMRAKETAPVGGNIKLGTRTNARATHRLKEWILLLISISFLPSPVPCTLRSTDRWYLHIFVHFVWEDLCLQALLFDSPWKEAEKTFPSLLINGCTGSHNIHGLLPKLIRYFDWEDRIF